MTDNDTQIQIDGGSALPKIGLGTWKIPNDMTSSVVHEAIRVGYRHLDCACDYGNEAEVGEGLAKAISDGLCKRDDIWVTSKLWNTYHDPKHVRLACERSLRDLQLDEIDLYHVHFPIALEFVPFEERYPPGWFFDPDAEKPAMKPVSIPMADTWGAMEELVEAGLVRRIGVCNQNISLLRELLTWASVRPAVHQVEMHPYLSQPKLLRFCSEERIPVTAFSPLGADSYTSIGMATADESVLIDPAFVAIANEVDRSPAQVALRWAVQRGTSAIPKTQNTARLVENLSVFDFSLSDGQMSQIDGLNRHQRFNDPGNFCERAFNTFFPIFD